MFGAQHRIVQADIGNIRWIFELLERGDWLVAEPLVGTSGIQLFFIDAAHQFVDPFFLLVRNRGQLQFIPLLISLLDFWWLTDHSQWMSHHWWTIILKHQTCILKAERWLLFWLLEWIRLYSRFLYHRWKEARRDRYLRWRHDNLKLYSVWKYYKMA